jgi:hypothetical protein
MLRGKICNHHVIISLKHQEIYRKKKLYIVKKTPVKLLLTGEFNKVVKNHRTLLFTPIHSDD